MGPSLLTWSQVQFKKLQESSCWPRQLCLPPTLISDSSVTLHGLTGTLFPTARTPRAARARCAARNHSSHFVLKVVSSLRLERIQQGKNWLLYLIYCFLAATLCWSIGKREWGLHLWDGWGEDEGSRLKSWQDVQSINYHYSLSPAYSAPMSSSLISGCFSVSVEVVMQYVIQNKFNNRAFELWAFI